VQPSQHLGRGQGHGHITTSATKVISP
jgi:hypothetical protein